VSLTGLVHQATQPGSNVQVAIEPGLGEQAGLLDLAVIDCQVD
jgi:hypothetical protein